MRERRGAGAGRAAALAGLASLALVGCGADVPDAPRALDVSSRFGEQGDEPGLFVKPRAIDADPADGTLWIIDMTARVQGIDASTGRCIAWWRLEDFVLGRPVGITVGPWLDGSSVLYVPETHYHRVSVFRKPTGMGVTPELLLRFGSYGHEPGQFIFPTDVAVLTDPAGRPERIYVAEYGGNDRISVFDTAGAFLFAFGVFGPGGEPDEPGAVGPAFNRPQAIAIDQAARELVVADAANHRLGRFSLEGELIGWIGSPGSAGDGPGSFSFPYGLALLRDGTVLVSEYGGNRLSRVRLSDGRWLGVYGRGGRGPGELASPWGVAELAGTVWVLDSGHGRVLGVRAPSPDRGGRG